MRKVLIIDGDREFLEMARSFLQASNFMVQSAHTADLARTRLREFTPDLILLSRDLLSSSGRLAPDGLDILREIKTDRSLKKIPLVLLINQAREQDLEKIRLLKYKAEDYACKPIADNDLLRRIENLIGFDPDETTGVFSKQKNSLSSQQLLAGQVDNPDFELAAQKEIQDLIARLEEEVIQSQKEADLSSAQAAASADQLAADFGLIQEKLREQEKRYQRIQEKSRKAIEVLEDRIEELKAGNKELEKKLLAAEAERKAAFEEKRTLSRLLEKSRELLLRFGSLKKGLEKDMEKAEQLINELDEFKK